MRARERLTVIVPIVFGAIFLLLYMLFESATEALVLILPCLYALTGGLLLQYLMGFNFSVAVAVGYIALFGIAVETGVVMVIYLHEALDLSLARGAVDREGIFAAALEGAVHRLRPKLMTVAVVMMSLAPILWESGIGSDVMKPIAAPIVGGMVTSTIHGAGAGAGAVHDDQGARAAGRASAALGDAPGRPQRRIENVE